MEEMDFSHEQTACPAESLLEFKFWLPVARADNVFGDRDAVCSCKGMKIYS